MQYKRPGLAVRPAYMALVFKTAFNAPALRCQHPCAVMLDEVSLGKDSNVKDVRSQCLFMAVDTSRFCLTHIDSLKLKSITSRILPGCIQVTLNTRKRAGRGIW